MKSPTQTTLPGVRDWSEPQDVINGSLAGTLADAARDGYDAARMLVIRDGYRVTFQRKPIVNTGDSCGDQHKHPVNIGENQRNLLNRPPRAQAHGIAFSLYDSTKTVT
jgi:hypothetical protein